MTPTEDPLPSTSFMQPLGAGTEILGLRITLPSDLQSLIHRLYDDTVYAVARLG